MDTEQRIGLLFGSFNPIHVGHTALANYLLEYAGLDGVWFVVSPHNPFKNSMDLLPETLRLGMVEMAIAGEQRFAASDIEFRLPKPSYTVDTMKKLVEMYPRCSFCIVIGSDNLAGLPEWKDGERLMRSFRFIVYPRAGYPVDGACLPANFEVVDAPLLDISSTFIRKGLREGKRLTYFMPAGVYGFIVERNLYRE